MNVMPPSRHYPKAPITEAIIDLRVEPRAELTLDDLDAPSRADGGASAKRNKTIKAMGLIEVGEHVSASASSEQTGWRYESGDGKLIWQSRFDGFTISRLAPYDRWSTFQQEARRLWVPYREVVRPGKLIRVAVRYVNRFDLPGPKVDLKRYFCTSPEVSPALSQDLNAFFMQIQISQDDIRSQLVINQTIVPPAREDVVSVVLDIDLFRSEEVPQEDPAIWDFFESLHMRKNEIFEACITDKARELIE
jgi:uncharacterized protein (TIGR04255 family)